jgi:hypothetical protein
MGAEDDYAITTYVIKKALLNFIIVPGSLKVIY